ncbi:hypothetical protein RFI_18756 [Reticulomyxa filosa]|uniref:Uncharacterized protein n=1 Tax=Reticulomyxa filosa TaxID=46433 RepID=X6MXG8_RETFI|nr:hypothetical protein RFI_18756 [Reticulomyxa filosa]|eukprot:ETO18509.1 hypothetical protein RFI_18756 [Reticulomyxa filosa]
MYTYMVCMCEAKDDMEVVAETNEQVVVPVPYIVRVKRKGPLDTWYHVLVSHDWTQKETKLFVNGKSEEKYIKRYKLFSAQQFQIGSNSLGLFQKRNASLSTRTTYKPGRHLYFGAMASHSANPKQNTEDLKMTDIAIFDGIVRDYNDVRRLCHFQPVLDRALQLRYLWHGAHCVTQNTLDIKQVWESVQTVAWMETDW